MDAPDPFTLQTLATIGGGALACSLIPNVLGTIFPLDKPPLRAAIALIIGLALQVGAFLAATGAHDIGGWIVAVINGFLVAGTALGVNQLGLGPAAGPPGDPGDGGGNFAPSGQARRYRTSWL